jgi:hypothetical protein
MSILHLNIHSIQNNNLQLETFLGSIKHLPVAFITEHFILDCDLSKFVIHYFSLASMYCRKHAKKGSGGSMILVNNIDFIDRSDIKNLYLENICVISAIELMLNNVKFVLVCIYRPPTGNIELFFKKFEFVVYKIHKENKLPIICGDFNINMLESTTTSNFFLDLLHICNLQQTIFDPTRYCKTTATIIDNISISKLNPHVISKCAVLNCHFSDHEAQVTTFRYSFCNNTTTPKTTKQRVLSENN